MIDYRRQCVQRRLSSRLYLAGHARFDFLKSIPFCFLQLGRYLNVRQLFKRLFVPYVPLEVEETLTTEAVPLQECKSSMREIDMMPLHCRENVPYECALKRTMDWRVKKKALQG